MYCPTSTRGMWDSLNALTALSLYAVLRYRKCNKGGRKERERAVWFLGSVLPTSLIHRHSSGGSRAVLKLYKSDIYLIESSLVQSPEESELRQSPLELHGRVGCRQTRW